MENISTFNSVKNVPSVPAETFPNGNTVVSPEILDFVLVYKSFLRKTVESILGLATTLIEAEGKLNKVDFSIFCKEVGLEKDGPTFVKLKKIGSVASRFTPFLDKLPNTWTTLYKLAKMDPNDFDRVSSNFNPFLTAGEIDRFVEGEKQKTSAHIDVSLNLKSLKSEEKLKLYNNLLDLKKEYDFELIERRDFVAELAAVKQDIAA